jgi:hypothetical protein
MEALRDIQSVLAVLSVGTVAFVLAVAAVQRAGAAALGRERP